MAVALRCLAKQDLWAELDPPFALAGASAQCSCDKGAYREAHQNLDRCGSGADPGYRTAPWLPCSPGVKFRDPSIEN